MWLVALVSACAAHRPGAGGHGPVLASGLTELDDRVPFGPDARAGELAQLRELLREVYSHLELKQKQWGVDLGELYARYEPLARRAETWSRYERVMAGFTSEFHDAHLAWRRARGPREVKRRIVRLGLETTFVGESLVITDIWPGSAAFRAGLARGDRIVGIDGQTVPQRLGALSSLRSWSRLEAARYDFAAEWPASRAEEGAPPEERRITRERTDGTYETLRVRPETEPRGGARKELLELSWAGPRAILRVRALGGGRTDFAAFSRRMAELSAEIFERSTGLVIDVRGNIGGYDTGAKLVASHLTARPLTGGHVRVRLSARARAARAQWRDLPEDPARPGWSAPQPVVAEPLAPRAYSGRIAVVMDAGCRSSCETLVLLLGQAGARLFGARTGGSSGAPIPLVLHPSGARVTVPAWALFDREGNPIEGVGITPDVAVDPAVIDGKDPALEAALAHVGGPS